MGDLFGYRRTRSVPDTHTALGDLFGYRRTRSVPHTHTALGLAEKQHTAIFRPGSTLQVLTPTRKIPPFVPGFSLRSLSRPFGAST